MSRRNARAKKIAALNDALRRNPADRSLGQTMLSAGVAAKDAGFQRQMFASLAAMGPKDFTQGNDPYLERDFHSFRVGERLLFFKIDYFARGDLRLASRDPADPAVTERVMTIMFANEY